MFMRPSYRFAAAWCCAAALAVAQAPSNNNCNGPLTVFAGTNPQPPSGTSGQFFTNVGAGDSNPLLFGAECASAFHKDVWFLYTASFTGFHTFRTCTPTGFAAGSLTNTVIAVYHASQCPLGFGSLQSAISCNDNSALCGAGSSRSSVLASLFDGESYLVRVGTPSASASGTFYLTILEPAAVVGDGCLLTNVLGDGLNTGLSFDGATNSSTNYGCSEWSSATYSDLWFRYVASSPVGSSEVVITSTGAVDLMSIYTGSCPFIGPVNLTPTVCDGPAVSFSTPQGTTTYFVRVGLASEESPALGFSLTINIHASPPNDDCSDAFVIYGGTHPFLAGEFQYFTTEGALSSSLGGSSCVTNTNSDVWFEYVATNTGMVNVNTDTPSGEAPGTMVDTVVAVFSSCGGAALACNDDGGVGLLSSLSFYAVQGVHYRIMVAEFGVGPPESPGTFWLNVYPQFSLAMSSPSGAGSLRINLAGGGHDHVFFTCLTLQQGLYPFGPFFGIEPTLTELMLQLNSGSEPFLGVLDGAGAYQFGPVGGLPPLTLYGVALEFDGLGLIAGYTNPTTWTIP
jgi:hypothetical protein